MDIRAGGDRDPHPLRYRLQDLEPGDRERRRARLRRQAGREHGRLRRGSRPPLRRLAMFERLDCVCIHTDDLETSLKFMISVGLTQAWRLDREDDGRPLTI